MRINNPPVGCADSPLYTREPFGWGDLETSHPPQAIPLPLKGKARGCGWSGVVVGIANGRGNPSLTVGGAVSMARVGRVVDGRLCGWSGGIVGIARFFTTATLAF